MRSRRAARAGRRPEARASGAQFPNPSRMAALGAADAGARAARRASDRLRCRALRVDNSPRRGSRGIPVGVRPALRLPDQDPRLGSRSRRPARTRAFLLVLPGKVSSLRPSGRERGIPVGRSTCAASAGSKPVVWARGSPRGHRDCRVLRAFRPGSRIPRAKTCRLGPTDFRPPDLRIILWVQTLDNENDGSKTSGPTTCIAVAPRFLVSSAFRTSQVRARLHSDASLRRGKTYATHRHACRVLATTK